MLSIDTNILLYAYAKDSPEHEAARSFVRESGGRDDVVISEWVLVELYNLLRNPAVFEAPLSAPRAAAVVQSYRRHPRWGLVAFPNGPTSLHDELWASAAGRSFPRRRIFDARMALCLRECGVSAFATSNVEDFRDFGFDRVWNPLSVAVQR
jgi:toxin-antitoxin system PIN domain toxin